MSASKRVNWLFVTILCCALVIIGRDQYRRKLSRDLEAALNEHQLVQMESLLLRGASFETETRRRIAIVLAAERGDASCLELLMRQEAPKMKPVEVDYMLRNAIRSDNPDVVRVLLSHGADPNFAQGVNMLSPLASALTSNHANVAQVLRSSGAHLTISEAAQLGEYADLKTALDHGEQPNQANTMGVTLLALAAENGSVPCVQLLLSHGAKDRAESKDPFQNEISESALMAAARAGKLETMQALLQGGSDINCRSSFVAIPQMHDDVAGVMEHSVLVGPMMPASVQQPRMQFPSLPIYYSKRYAGSTALIEAAKNGHVECVRYLLKHGADVRAHTNEGTTALIAALNYMPPLPQKALTGGSVGSGGPPMAFQEQSEYLPYSGYSKEEHADTARLLIAAGADINATDSHTNALCLACRYGYNDVVSLLLAHGADINGPAPYGQTALMSALGRVIVVSSQGRTAPSAINDKLVLYLLAHGAEVNHRNSMGMSALMLAAFDNEFVSARALLDRGADVHAVTNSGRTVLDFAFSSDPALESRGWYPREDKMRMVALLRERGAHLTFMEAAKYADITDLKWNIGRGVDVNATTSIKVANSGYMPPSYATNTGITALMQVSETNHPEAVSLLLNHGAKLEATDSNGWTALMYAAEHDQADNVKLLLDHGAKMEAREQRGWTALMIATSEGNRHAIRTLIDHHADVHVKNNRGKGLMDIARSRGRMDILSILQQAGATE